MDYVNLGIIAFLLGGLLSVIYPYLTAWLETGEQFQWKYVTSRLIAVILTGLLAISQPGFVETLAQTAQAYNYPVLFFLSVLFTTFGVGQFGRESQKLGSAALNRSKD